MTEFDWNSIFEYDETCESCLRWKMFKRAGKPTSNKPNMDGYYKLKVLGKTRLAHRIVYEMFYGAIPDGKVIDHINRLKTDNRVENLRVVDFQTNACNRTVSFKSESGLSGVYRKVSKGIDTWFAYWVEHETGLYRTKQFSIPKYGYDVALQNAIYVRENKLIELRSQGASYTEGHGTAI